MTPQTLELHIATLDAEIAAFQQDAKRGRTRREREATELLVQARDKLVEELAAREGVQKANGGHHVF